jgi:hypothetical protein
VKNGKGQPFWAPISSFLIGKKFESENWEEVTPFREMGIEESPFSPLVQSVFPLLFQEDHGE